VTPTPPRPSATSKPTTSSPAAPSSAPQS
jgi:hypothetical protein